MFQSRQRHVFENKENNTERRRIVNHPSKTPAPSKTTSRDVLEKTWAMTTGLRGEARVLKRTEANGKDQGLEFIKPQKLVFKDQVVPTTVKRAHGLLGDKTNTSKKAASQLQSKQIDPTSKVPNTSSLLKTPGQKKSVRVVAVTPTAGPKFIDDEAFITPAPNRARRSPVVESPVSSLDDGETSAPDVQTELTQDVEVPDVEYGPPTAIREPEHIPDDDKINVESLHTLLNGDMPFFIYENGHVDVTSDILEEEKQTEWQPEDHVQLQIITDEEYKSSMLVLPHSPDPAPRNSTSVSRRILDSKRPIGNVRNVALTPGPSTAASQRLRNNTLSPRTSTALPGTRRHTNLSSHRAGPVIKSQVTKPSVPPKPVKHKDQSVSTWRRKWQEEEEAAKLKADKDLEAFKALKFSSVLLGNDEGSFRFKV